VTRVEPPDRVRGRAELSGNAGGGGRRRHVGRLEFRVGR
jgi:hypothetical protein